MMNITNTTIPANPTIPPTTAPIIAPKLDGGLLLCPLVSGCTVGFGPGVDITVNTTTETLPLSPVDEDDRVSIILLWVVESGGGVAPLEHVVPKKVWTFSTVIGISTVTGMVCVVRPPVWMRSLVRNAVV